MKAETLDNRKDRYFVQKVPVVVYGRKVVVTTIAPP